MEEEKKENENKIHFPLVPLIVIGALVLIIVVLIILLFVFGGPIHG